MRHLVEGLTALARIDAGQIEGGRERLRAAELATRAMALEAPGLASAGCVATVEVVDDSELDGHAALLEIALANLLRNAARHAPGRAVALRVDRVGRADGPTPRIVFTVDDAGPGVAASEREALFDRFTRGREARGRDRAGLGLGLPIAREVARRHGGDCVLETSPLGGLRAVFSVAALATAPSLRDI